MCPVRALLLTTITLSSALPFLAEIDRIIKYCMAVDMANDDVVLDPDDRAVYDAEAGRILGVRPSTLATWRSQGKGPRYRKPGRRPEYTPRFLRDYLKSRERDPESAEARRRQRALAVDSNP
jgi:hypothetical protein